MSYINREDNKVNFELSPIDRKNYNPKHAVRRVMAVLALVAVGASGVGSCSTIFSNNNSPEKQAEKLEKKILSSQERKNMTISGDIIVLHEGAKVRNQPLRYVFNPESGSRDLNVDNVEYTVEEGKNMVITSPLIWNDADSQKWAGFTMPSDDVNNDSGNNMLWINVSALINDEDPAITTYHSDSGSDVLGGFVLNSDGEGKYWVTNPDENREFAIATKVDNEELHGTLSQLGIKQK